MADIKTAASAVPSVLVAKYVESTETTQYTAAVGATVQILSAAITNTDTVARTVSISVVKSGGTAGASNRIIPAVSVPAGTTVTLPEMFLGEGDFISGIAGIASTITLIITGIVFSNSTGGTLAGIQDDFIGTGGHGTASASGTNKTGTAANRYLLGAMMVQESGSTAGYGSYTSLGMTCNDGTGALTMSKLVSVDFNNGSTIVGSVHIFGRANVSSGLTQTLVGSAAAAGATMGIVIGSKSYSGVASVTGAVSNGPVGSAVVNLGITSATGHVPFYAGAFYQPPQQFAMTGGARTRFFDGITSGFTLPQWLLVADAIGAATITASTGVATPNASVAVDLVPA